MSHLFLKIAAVAQLSLALTMVVGGSLRGAGDTRYILTVTLAGMWAVRLPLAFAAAYWWKLGLAYVWCAMAADWFIRMALLLIRYHSERWRENQVIRASAPTASGDRG